MFINEFSDVNLLNPIKFYMFDYDQLNPRIVKTKSHKMNQNFGSILDKTKFDLHKELQVVEMCL